MRSPEPALIDLALAQHGAFAARQAHRVGVSDLELSAMAAGGVLVRVRQGAYLLGSELAGLTKEESYAVEVRAVLLTRARRAWASHHAALALAGLPLRGVDLRHIDLCGRVKRSFTRSGVKTHPLPAGEPCLLLGGAPTVSTELSLVQTAAVCGLQPGVVAADAALQRGLVTCASLKRALERAALGARASERVAKMLELTDPAAESPGESLTRLLLHGLGWRFSSQVNVRDARGLIGRVDFLVEGRIVVEFDGLVKYAGADGREALAAEKRREDRLRAAGYEVVRLTWADLERPEHCARLLREARARLLARTR